MTAGAVPLATWAGRSVDALRTDWAVPRLHIFDSVGSTNDVARAHAADGAPALSTFIAEYQSSGRGRFGRVWTAPPGSALLLSIVLRPPGGPDAAPSTTPLRIGLAVAKAIERVAITPVLLKWPNDLLAPDGRKLAGILCEAATTGGASSVIAGIGINTGQTPADWPPELRDVATSLAALTGTAIDRAILAAAVIDEVRRIAPAADRPLDSAERADWDHRDALRGHDVAIDGELAGTAAGISTDGALLLRTSRGPRRVRSGTVRRAIPTNAGGNAP